MARAGGSSSRGGAPGRRSPGGARAPQGCRSRAAQEEAPPWAAADAPHHRQAVPAVRPAVDATRSAGRRAASAADRRRRRCDRIPTETSRLDPQRLPSTTIERPPCSIALTIRLSTACSSATRSAARTRAPPCQRSSSEAPGEGRPAHASGRSRSSGPPQRTASATRLSVPDRASTPPLTSRSKSFEGRRREPGGALDDRAPLRVARRTAPAPAGGGAARGSPR